ncbi:hypothetical protein D3C71_1274230 [compost metagenome]
MAQGVVDAFEIVQIEKQQCAMRAIACAQRRSARQPVHQQAPVGQARELVIKRQPLDLGLGLLAFSDVARHTPVAREPAFRIKHGLPTDRHPVGLPRSAGPLHFKVVKHLVRCHRVAVCAPLALGHKGAGKLPKCRPIRHLITRPARSVVAIAVQPNKAKLGILLPVPVRRQLREAAPPGLTRAQGLQGGQVIGNVGEGADPPTFLQHPRAHLDIPTARCSPHVDVGHVEMVTMGCIFGRHIGPRGMVQELKLRAKIAALGLEPDHILHLGLCGQQRFGQVQQLQIPLVVNTNPPLRVHIADALRHAGQCAFERPRLVGQKGAGAGQLGLDRATGQLCAACHLQLPHGVQKRL